MFRGLSLSVFSRCKDDAPAQGTSSISQGTAWRDYIICLLLSCITLAAYWQVRQNEFVNFDDPAYLYNNPKVFYGLTREGVKWAFTTGHASNWHPLTWLSLMLDCQLFGEHVGWHHLENVAWHVANTLLLFGFLRRATAAPWRSAMVAALFAVHPLHVESVAWASERKDVLSTFFGLLAIHAYLGYVTAARGEARPVGKGKATCYFAVMLFFVLSLLAKPMLVTFPFLLLLLDFWPLGRISDCGFQIADLKKDTASATSSLASNSSSREERKERGAVYSLIQSAIRNPQSAIQFLFLEKIPFLFLSVGSSVVTYLAQKQGGAVMPGELAPLYVRLANSTIGYATYLKKMIWPRHLCVLYPYPTGLSVWEVAAAGGVLMAITVGVIRWGRKYPYLPVGWFWYLGTLLPVIGIVQVGSQAYADRYTYFPLIGIFILLVWAIADLSARMKYGAWFAGLGSAAILLDCVTSTWHQVQYWKDSVVLFKRALEVCPGSPISHHDLGYAYFMQGKYDEAIPHFREALRLWPAYYQALDTLGNCLNLQGKLDEAVPYYRRALELNPNYYQAHYSLAATLASQGELAEARSHFLEALRLQPDYMEAHVKFGNLLVLQGELNAAVPHYLKAIQIEPKCREAELCLAGVLARQKNFDQAVAHYRAALKVKSEDPSALNDLAWILATEKNPQVNNTIQAVELARRACDLEHNKNPNHLDTLGVALSEAGRFDEAIKTTREAVALARSAGEAKLADQIEGRLKYYEQRISYHAIVR